MRLTFLGGADEIGASATLVEIGGARLLVDAGLRQRPRSGERIPALAGLGAKPDAVLLTHAHLDHSGALPVAAQSFPDTPIFMTRPTLDIIGILLQDSAKIMALGEQGDLPLYGAAEIGNCLAACRAVPFDYRLQLAANVEVTFRPAGHILGAASLFIESDEGSLVLSGDVHATGQLTVPGLELPAHRPDVFVIESTYGGKRHASRALEEKRLIARLGEVVGNGGSVLLPSFAVGRAQELALLVSRAMEGGELPRVPVFLDGMVKQVCAVYGGHPEVGSPWFRHRCQTKGNPFFHEGSPLIALWDPRDRTVAAQTRPAIIISSSGMVTVGSPSAFYAQELAADPRCVIAINSYQDEESPGRKLLELAERGSGELETANGSVPLRCRVEKFSFSAHSDGFQVAEELRACAPRRVVLVHGDGGSRTALAAKLAQDGVRDISLPELGGQVTLAGKRTKREQVAFSAPVAEHVTGNEAGRMSFDLLYALAEKLFTRDKNTRTYSTTVLLSESGLAPDEIGADTVAALAALLPDKKESPFIRVKGQPGVWRLRVGADQKPWRPPDRTRTHAELEQVVRDAFPGADLLKVGLRMIDRTIIVRAAFPKPFLAQYADRIPGLEAVTGWRVQVPTEPNHDRLAGLALSLLPAGWQPGTPSLRSDTETVTVKCERWDAAAFPALRERFRAESGFALVVVPKSTAGDAMPPATSERMEMNEAFRVVREAFANQPHELVGVGFKEGRIQVTFITPAIGERYKELLAGLTARTGWAFSVRPTPDQHRLAEIARELIPSEWGWANQVSFSLAEQQVTAGVRSRLACGPLGEPVTQRFLESTGWHLRLKAVRR